MNQQQRFPVGTRALRFGGRCKPCWQPQSKGVVLEYSTHRKDRVKKRCITVKVKFLDDGKDKPIWTNADLLEEENFLDDAPAPTVANAYWPSQSRNRGSVI